MNSHGFRTNILVLDGKNWDRWNALTKSLFGAQDCLDVVLNGYDELVENPTCTEKCIRRE
ncbi:retrovirus-related Pol polyprotein from transposon TNT 1-94 [Trifolium pratense]|uniref:Retrovirus-related Pol polyprotein from transposon TNT 1-94 n=1 Tax=Trifolium pratense TaxID=57577 RepID=A0A2K3KGX2_TRIPR|nr:retrovirus-related Pol polyprotein from transposon TNT 1-94 [Trifolium pratense]